MYVCSVVNKKYVTKRVWITSALRHLPSLNYNYTNGLYHVYVGYNMYTPPNLFPPESCSSHISYQLREHIITIKPPLSQYSFHHYEIYTNATRYNTTAAVYCPSEQFHHQ